VKLSIVVPAHNEEDNIAAIINKIEESLDFDYELIIVNDHSQDATAEIVNKLITKYSNIRMVDNSCAKGFANALRAGFGAVNTDLVIPVMGDLCDDLATIKVMLKKIDEGYDVVCGARYTDTGARLGGSKLKGMLSSFAGRSLYCLLGIPTHDIANAFKMYRKKVIDSIDTKSFGFEISMELPLKAYYLGFKIIEVPTVWKERVKGKSSFKIFKLLPAYLRLYFWALIRKMRG